MTEIEVLNSGRVAKFTPSSATYETIVKRVDDSANVTLAAGKKLKELSLVLRHRLNGEFVLPSEIRRCVADLRTFNSHSPVSIDEKAIDALEAQANCVSSKLTNEFSECLQDMGKRENILTKFIGEDRYAVGPFELNILKEKELAVIKYSKLEIEAPIRLDPALIIKTVKILGDEIFAPIENADALAADFEQALRVAAVRAGKTWSAAEIRADIPSVAREMSFIRQMRLKNGKGKKGPMRPYSLSRFIVELKGLLQSERNLHAESVFVPEPAVIENAKDPKKSLFIPHDLYAGFGEGTYFQALCLRVRKANRRDD